MERYYTSRDLVRAACAACEGCGECCRGMADTILMDPYDAHLLSLGTGRPFASFLENEIGLTRDGELIVPHIVMQEGTDACAFLTEEGRCGIHACRPGICRLYPLARKYREDGIFYFLPEGGCEKSGKTKVRISRFLGYEDVAAYEAFKREWYDFTAKLREYLEGTEDLAEKRQVNLFLLESFYLTDFRKGRFFEEIREKIERVRKVVRF